MFGKRVKQVQTDGAGEWWKSLCPGDTIRSKPGAKIPRGAELLNVVSVSESTCLCENIQNHVNFLVQTEGLVELFELYEKTWMTENPNAPS
jgi:hypothetical protein